MSKIITVFGATGNQGGSVVKSILSDPVLFKELTIRRVTRDMTKESSIALKNKGVQMVEANMNSKSAVTEAIKGSYTVFLVTNYFDAGILGIKIQ